MHVRVRALLGLRTRRVGVWLTHTYTHIHTQAISEPSSEANNKQVALHGDFLCLPHTCSAPFLPFLGLGCSMLSAAVDLLTGPGPGEKLFWSVREARGRGEGSGGGAGEDCLVLRFGAAWRMPAIQTDSISCRARVAVAPIGMHSHRAAC